MYVGIGMEHGFKLGSLKNAAIPYSGDLTILA